MFDAILFRNPSNSYGTFGVLAAPEHNKLWYSLERPWQRNKRNVSCIPAGDYIVVWEYSPHFGRNLYEVKDVIGRTEIKFHPANWQEELKGCIALGKKIFNKHGEMGLQESQKAVREFEKTFAGKRFNLKIIWADYTI